MPRLRTPGGWRIPALTLALAPLAAACVGSIAGDPSGFDDDPTGPGGPAGSGARPGNSAPGAPPGSSATGGTSATGPGGPGTQPPATGGAPPAASTGAGPAQFRRLTRREYDNTIRDLLGIQTRAVETFPSDKDRDFAFPRAVQVATLDAEALRTSAEALAVQVVSKLAALLPCDPRTTGEPTCARQFVQSFGLRAYRRPLFADEAMRMAQLYETGRSTLKLPFAEALGLVVETILQSPGFVYLWAVPPAPAAREGVALRLSHYEIASRLSYFLWGSMPDKDLFDAAAAGQLGTEAAVEAQARRMIRDPRARQTMSVFVENWLYLDELGNAAKSTTAYKDFNDTVRSAMNQENRAFAESVLFDGDGRWETLLTAGFSYLNKALGPVYGMTLTSATPQRTELNTDQRRGILTQAGWLTLTGARDGSHPTKRGLAVWTTLLCRELPPPPPGVPSLKPLQPTQTTRQLFAAHLTNDCAVCHQFVDPIGFAFEHYDGIGRFRTKENGIDVDASGAVTLDGEARTFRNAVELVGLLARSPEVRHCLAQHWTKFALARYVRDEDRPSVDAAAAKLGASGDVRDLLVAIAASRAFRYRAINPGEVLP